MFASWTAYRTNFDRCRCSYRACPHGDRGLQRVRDKRAPTRLRSKAVLLAERRSLRLRGASFPSAFGLSRPGRVDCRFERDPVVSSLPAAPMRGLGLGHRGCFPSRSPQLVYARYQARAILRGTACSTPERRSTAREVLSDRTRKTTRRPKSRRIRKTKGAICHRGAEPTSCCPRKEVRPRRANCIPWHHSSTSCRDLPKTPARLTRT